MHGKMHRDNKGMSFVEVLCAVAILGLVSGIIGSVIVISTRTYNRGISETNIQQEAQLAANNIGDIVKDACSVIYGASGQKYIQNGDERDKDGKPYVASDTDPNEVKVGAAGVTELSILTNDKKQYTVKYYHNNYGSDGNPAEASLRKTLWYEIEDKKASTTSSLQLMAKDITAFTADTTKFKDNKTIELTITVNDGEREIPMNYTMTARNEAGEGVEYTPSSGDPAAIIIEENNIVLVPGEKYKVPFSAMGLSTVEWDSSTGLEGAISMVDSTAELIVPKNLTDTTEKTVLLKGNVDGVSAAIKVRFRKVTNVRVSHRVNTKDSVSGMKETVGTVYTFSANVSGSELAKNVAYDYDRDYPVETAQAVEWSYKLSLDGGSTDSAFYNWPSYTSTSDGSDGYNCTYSNDNADVINGVDGYIEVLETKENAQVPQLSLKLKKNLPAGFKLTVRATSKHAKGVNKAAGKEGCDSNYYAAGYGIDPKDIHYGETVIEPRETVVNKNLEIILEPQQIGRIKLEMKGGLVSDLNFDYSDAKDLSGSGTDWNKEEKTAEEYLSDIVGTKAVYDNENDEVVIKLGKNERGSGSNGTDPYTFTIDVKVGSDVKTTITVHVRRVDTVHIDAKINDKDRTTMDLKLRFNADTEVDNIIKYLIDATDKNIDGQPLAYKALTTRVTIEVLDKNNKVNDALTQIAVWGTYEGVDRDKTKESGIIEKVKGDWNKDFKRNNKTIYRIENTKPARISYNGSRWNMEQTPELDIKPLGLGMGEKIKVTMEAMHPAGTNNTGKVYDENGVKDVYILNGQEIIDMAKKNDDIIVEPYQVNNEGNGAMGIPLYLAPSVEAIQVKLEGNDSNTRVLVDNVAYSGTVKIIAPGELKNGKKEMLLGLNISRTEEGATFEEKAGRIKMTIMAYSETETKPENLLDSIEVYLGVRRVTEVTIENKDAFENKTGQTITLKAQAAGLRGTEYFDRQVRNSDEKYDPEWDSSDKYKSPYKLKWSLYYKDGSGKVNETEISKSEYFSEVKENTEGAKNNIQVISFKLNKALPKGAQIRATSVHAGNKDGEAENRSGLNYVKDNKYKKAYPEGIVYDYIEVKSSLIVAEGFQRADEWDFASNKKTFDSSTTDIPNIRSMYFGDAIYNSTQRTFFRYKEAGMEWNASNKKYHIMDDNGEQAASFSGDLGSRLFLPNKEYELEIVNVVYGTGRDNGKKVIYWPLDEELLEEGRGWKEEGYELWDGTWGYPVNAVIGKDQNGNDQWGTLSYADVYKRMKDTPQTPHNYLIPKTEIYFDKVDNVAETIAERTKTIGSESAPKQIKNITGTDSNGERHFAVKLAPTSFNIEKTQAHFTATIDKWENGNWTFMEELTQYHSLDENKYNWFMQVSVPKYDIYHVRPSASGKYRIRAVVTGMAWMEIKPESGLFETDSNKKYKSFIKDKIEVFDMSDESGVMYIQLN